LEFRRLPLVLRCLIAADLTLVAWLLRVDLFGWEPGFAYAPFVPVIVLATAMLGLIPGLVASLLGWLLAIYSFVEPVGLLSLDDWDDVVYAIMFPAVAAFVAVLIEVFRVMSGEGDHR
jgi:K+-sensing histidine kinase KdpD